MTELEDIARQALPWPTEDANKFSRGKLLLVAGSARYPGAAALAARASQRMGAGYTEVVCAPESVVPVWLASPALVVRSWDDWNIASIPASRAGKPIAVCMGPGFDASDDDEATLMFDVLAAAQCPVIIDGGALSFLCQKRALRYLERRFVNGLETVITPHGGEAARLVEAWGLDANLQGAELAQALANAFSVIAALKGPVTYIADGERVLAMDEGTPALAKAGTGDVLAGMVGALLAQGVSAFEAAACAVLLHARAGCIAAETFTDIGVTAEDVVEAIPAAIRAL